MGFALPNAQTAVTPVPPVANPCLRPAAGSVAHDPPALFSSNGVLNVRFSYQHVIDPDARELFCFMMPDGLQNPTLHVNPGDQLNITVTNNTPAGTAGMMINPPNCGNKTMKSSSDFPSNGHLDFTGTTLTFTALPSPRYRAAPPGRSLWTASTM